MQTHSPNDSSELFTGFLDKQIDYLFKINTIPGWTIWTLVGALVTLIWLAFKEVTTSSPNIYAAIVIFLYLSYLSSLFPIKESNTKINTGVMRFGIFNEVLYGKQRALVFHFCRTLFCGILLFLFFRGAWEYFVYIIFLYWSILAGSMAFYVIIAFFNIPFLASGPVKRNPHEKLLNIVGICTTLIWIIGFYGFSAYVFLTLNPALADFKLPALIFASLYILEKLINVDINLNSSAIRPLADIRTKLMLHELSYEDAFREVKIILLGYEAGELFKKDFSQLLEAMREISIKQKEATGTLTTLKTDLNKHFAKTASMDKTTLQTNIHHLQELAKSNHGSMTFFETKLEYLRIKTHMLTSYGYTADLYDEKFEELKTILITITQELADIDKQMEELDPKIMGLK